MLVSVCSSLVYFVVCGRFVVLGFDFGLILVLGFVVVLVHGCFVVCVCLFFLVIWYLVTSIDLVFGVVCGLVCTFLFGVLCLLLIAC